MSTQLWIQAGIAAVQIGGLLYIGYINHKQFKLEQEHLDKQAERLKGLK